MSMEESLFAASPGSTARFLASPLALRATGEFGKYIGETGLFHGNETPANVAGGVREHVGEVGEYRYNGVPSIVGDIE